MAVNRIKARSKQAKYNREKMDNNIQLTCDDRLLKHIRTNLKKFEVITSGRKNLKRAAVAITIVDVDQSSRDRDVCSCDVKDNDAALILTRRSSRLRNHAGQWALPGGSLDSGETPEDAALRELSEEVGLSLGKERIIGRLDDFATRSGFIMTPIVVWGGHGLELKPNPVEVGSIHRIPIREFMRLDAPLLDRIPESENPVLFMPVGRDAIAAPTAALLYQFREVAILGKETRVAHYEQPYFAWK